MKKLVIVESPNKIKSIEKYLGADYIIKASVGHIVKLPSTGEHGFGVDMATWTPKYKIDPKKKKVVNEIKKALKEVDQVYIATDPDREGEAIGENLVQFLEIKDNYSRIRFNEISKSAIEEAMKNTSKINYELVNSQIARRILDRIIGYKLSGLMKRKIKNAPGIASAGRVQSIALKLVVAREELIDKFIPIQYTTINAMVKGDNIASLYIEKNEFKNKSWISPKLIEEIKSKFTKKLEVVDIKKTIKKERQITPFKQSTLYKRAHSSLGISARGIQSAAQKLYEGYGDGGLISYPRTDSTRLSKTFVEKSRKYIALKYSDKYIAAAIKGTAGAQDAHEAIRPVSLELEPKMAMEKFNLSSNEQKVYTLIWNNTMQSLMEVPIRENLRYELMENDLTYKMSSSKVIFDGYYKVVGYNKTKELPLLVIGDVLKVYDYIIEDKETKPPARYNDGSLIEQLDLIKVGRPSTFASTVNVLKDRNYVTKIGSALKPTDFGKIVNKKLIHGFPNIITETYTAKLEKELDEIALGKINYKSSLELFWNKFKNVVTKNEEEMEVTIIPLIEVDKKCPKCLINLVKRTNKRDGSTFLACPNFPEHKYAEPDPDYVPKFKKRYKKETVKK